MPTNFSVLLTLTAAIGVVIGLLLVEPVFQLHSHTATTIGETK